MSEKSTGSRGGRSAVPPDRSTGPTVQYLSRLGQLLRETDRNEKLSSALNAARRAAPGGDQLADVSLSGGRASDRLARLVAESGADEPSATRELGLGAIQLWQALTRSRQGAKTTTEITIMFTDLVGFSSWALQAGDDHVLRLLREVGRATETAVRRHGGSVVKSLGDGVMAVFADTEEAIAAGHEACTAVSAITIDDYRPQLRVGMHAGRPRQVRRDFIGVDVNVAARVADAASGGEVLVSGPALDSVDRDRFTVRRRRRFRAKGAPKDLDVYSVVPRYSDDATGPSGLP